MFRRLSFAALLLLIVAAVLSTPPAAAFQAPVPDVVLPDGLQVTEYYRYSSGSSSPRACCPHGLEFGVGGGFGNDLFFVDAGTSWPGAGIWRLNDANGDGDAMDPGEGVRVRNSTSSGPPPLGLTTAHDIGNGFDNDMFFTDDRSNLVWRLSDNGGPLALSVFSSGYWTPAAAMFGPHGDRLLVLEESNFTVYGGGADGRIYSLSDSGVRTIWADNSQTPRGLWDIQGAAMSNDGWLLTVNAGIRVGSGYQRELLAFRDNNNDGDARDPGEVKLMADAGPLGQGFSGDFDDHNVYWIAWGDRVMRLEDLNGDGDYWDVGANTFDTDEFSVWAYNFPGFLVGIEIAADGTKYLGMSNNESPGSSSEGVILRIGPAGPPTGTNHAPTADAGLDATYECGGPGGAHVTLNGTLSDDPDGDALTFSWMEGATLLGEGEMLEVDLPKGTHLITLTVMDPLGETDSADVTITVEDTTPPTISGVPGPIELDVAGPGGTPSSAVDFSGVTATDTCDGTVAVTDDAPAIFPVGTTTVTFTATDAASNVATASTTVTVVDSTPPTISGLPAGPIVVELAGPGGTPSSAVDFSGVTASDLGDGAVAVTNDAPAVFPPGETVVTFTASDSSGNVATASVTVEVIDTVAPTITSATSDVSIIATPNHKMIPVNLSVLCDDASGATACSIVNVTSNEAINGLGDGNTDPDWIITGPLTVELRAERSGTGNGRIYTITVECADAAGNASYADVTVTVPKSQGNKK